LFERVVQAASANLPFGYLVTPNVDILVRLNDNPAIQYLFDDAWACVNDSRIVQTLGSLSGLTLPACPGSDLTKRLFEEVIDPDEPVVIIGGAQNVVESIQAKFGLTNMRWHCPPMGLRTNPEAIAAAAQFCADHPARFVFLCVGNPQQEMVAHAIKMRGDCKGLGLCVGASLEFLAGTRARAPQVVQWLRLEWLFRLLNEPKTLWRRYILEGPKIFKIWQSWRKGS
jgi:N-acetylglucosaminyldiphosphoundecaprenol N-acetyl-beta-D-mannosaminyltransferase